MIHNRNASRSLLSWILIAFIIVGTIFWINTQKSSFSAKPPFSLLVGVVFVDESSKRTFLDLFSKFAKYVREKEPTTIAYEVLLSDKDPLRALVLERYKDKEHAYLQIHKKSQDFLAFRTKLKGLQDAGQMTLEGQSYVDSLLGFIDGTKMHHK